MSVDNQSTSAKVANEPEPKGQSEPKTQVQPEPKVQVQLEPKAQVQLQPKAQMQQESKVQVQPEPEVKVQSEPKAQIQQESKAEVQPEPEIKVQSEPKAQMQQDSKAEVQPEPEVKVQSEPKTQIQQDSKAEVQPEPEVKVQPELEVKVQSELKAQMQQDSKAEVHPELEVKVQLEPEVKVQSEPKLQMQQESKAEVQPETNATVQQEPKAQVQPEKKTQVQPQAKAQLELETKTLVQPQSKVHVQQEPKAQMQPQPKAQEQPQHNFHIKDVWAHNLKEEFALIRQLVPKYSYVAMDTEFPGVVARPIGDFKTTTDYQYQLLRCNVNLLRIIQLGFSFFDENGKTPPGPYSTWQFNFKFSLSEDMYAQDSIELLTNSRIQFKKHEENGIEPIVFAEYMITSGLVLTDTLKWITFHSSFDFGYFLKMLTDEKLPQKESDFLAFFALFFPYVYDIKYLLRSCKNLKGGLQEVADQLDLKRIGPQHQAGSDSLLTGMIFFKIRDIFFEGMIDCEKYCGHLYGLGITTLNNEVQHDNN